MSVAVGRVRQCLRVLSDAETALSASEVAVQMGLTRPAATRILEALREDDLVRKDESTRHYYLGLGLYAIGAAALERVPLVRAARDELAQFAARFQRPLHYVVLFGNETLLMEHYEWVSGRVVGFAVGRRRTWHHTAMGRILVAFSRPEVVDRLYATATPESSNGAGPLGRDELACLRAQGYAESRGWLSDTHYGLAVPLFDASGFAVAAIGMPASQEELEPIRRDQLLRPLLDLAARISSRLGYHPSSHLVET